MPAKNIECQLAQGQIGRYLAGAPMSEESVSQLEGHIAECEECTAFVDQKRKSLRELATLRKAAIFVEEPEEDRSSPEPNSAKSEASATVKPTAAKALIDAIREKSAAARESAPILETKREPATPRMTHWKALAYSSGLGLVLYGMTFLTANPTALFGERAVAETSAPAAGNSTDAMPDPAPAATKEDGDPFTEDTPAPTPTAASPETSAIAEENTTTRAATTSDELPITSDTTNSNPSTPPQPNVQVRSTPVSRPAVRTPRRRPAPVNRRPNSIRVYDENGRPITGG